jgi:membrane-bound serine protease (ClpP class)
MDFLLNPNVGYFLIVSGVMLLLLTINDPKFTLLKVVMVLCFVGAGVEFVYLKGNAWAFLVIALSPLPFFIALRQPRVHLALFVLTVLMLTLGSFFLFTDQNGCPTVNYGFAGFVSALCGGFLWITSDRMRNVQGVRLSADPNSVVGLMGEVRTDIESHAAGSVLVDGELWQAHSKTPIRAGSTVRVLRQDGFVLTVKEAEPLTKK